MGQIVSGAFHTHEGREMGFLVRELVRPPPQPLARVACSPVHLRRGPLGGRGEARGPIGVERHREMDYQVRLRVGRSNVLRPRMISFLHHEGGHRYRGYYIRSVGAEALQVTRVSLSGLGSAGGVRVDAERRVRRWDVREASVQESLELLGHLGSWRVPITVVALSSTAVLLLGFGPGAATMGLGVSELGGAAVTLTTQIAMNALSAAVVSFLHQHYQAMIREVPDARGRGVGAARFWESRRYDFGDILRRCLIDAVGAGVTSAVIRTPTTSGGFESFLGHVVGRVGNAFTGVISTLFEVATRDPSRMPTEEQIRSQLLTNLSRDLSLRIIH